MPAVRITAEQQSQLEELRTELASEYSGRYSSVTERDVMTYLLDLADSIGDPSALPEERSVNQDTSATEETTSSAARTRIDTESPDTSRADTAEQSLESMLKLLETHREKWGESDGEEPYEVELPDGEVETARTKDDVKAILFRHYR